MSKLPKAFKRKDHAEMADFSAIAAGDYIVKVTKSEYKANSKKNGHLLAVTLEVQNKEHKGHKVFVNLNLDNPSETAVEIANNELATICDAIGKAAIKDTDELMGKLMIVKLKVKDDRNEVSMYSSMDSASDSSGDELEDDDEPELDDEDSDDDDDESSSDVDPEDVKALAKKYKKMADGDALKEALEEYDIKKIKEIGDLDEDDLESLKDDLEELIEEG